MVTQHARKKTVRAVAAAASAEPIKVSVVLSPSLHAEIKQMAEIEHRKMSPAIAILVERGLRSKESDYMREAMGAK